MNTTSVTHLLCLLGLSACQSDKSQTPAGTDSASTSDDSGNATTDSGGSGSDVGTDDSGEPIPSAGCTDAKAPAALGTETCVSEAPCSWNGDQSYGYFGYVVAAGQDVNGDGRDDFLVGAPTADGSDGTTSIADAGRVTLVSGALLDKDEMGVLAEFSGLSVAEYNGTSVALVGDVNGDGIADALAGARGTTHPDTGILNVGAVHLLLGKTDWAKGESWEPEVTFTGTELYSRTGLAVAGAGDMDGDGLAEMLASGKLQTYEEKTADVDYGIGEAYVLAGSATGFSSDLTDADLTLTGEDDGDSAGRALAGGDLDGDGYADIAVGAPYTSTGTVYLWPGSADAFSVSTASLSEAAVKATGGTAGDSLGWSVTTGDITGDGIDDLVVGAPLSDEGWPNGGEVRVYAGHEAFFTEGAELMARFVGEFDDQQLGTGLNASGDLDGDGVHELLMGAVSSWEGLNTKAGKTYGVYGKADGWPKTATSAAGADFIVHGGATEDYLGRASATGDLNGDGLDDLVIGSGYTNHSGYYDVGTTYLFWGATR